MSDISRVTDDLINEFEKDYSGFTGNVIDSLRYAFTKLAQRGIGPQPTGPTWDDVMTALGELCAETNKTYVVIIFRGGSGYLVPTQFLEQTLYKDHWENGPESALAIIQAAMPKPEPEPEVTFEQMETLAKFLDGKGIPHGASELRRFVAQQKASE